MYYLKGMKKQNTIKSNIDQMRHSGAHLLAAAVSNLYPNVKLAIGPTIDYGFYYDFDFGDIQITESDLPKIEIEMIRLKKENYPFEKIEMNIKEAQDFLKKSKQEYSLALLDDIKKYGTTIKKDQDPKQSRTNTDIVTFYKSGSFINLCRGGHIDNFGQIGDFKLISIAGAYFRGDEKNKMLTRIYAACFPTKEELNTFLKDREERKGKDHRILGPKLGLFMFSEEIGAGLPILLPKGEILKKLLIEYMREKQEKLGYIYVSTPIITNEKLFQLSGHTDFYSNDMYKILDKENNTFYIKPMNCPFHHMIYKNEIRSYKELPIKIAEDAPVYRYERSGTLTGLIRTRGPITQNDSHIYTSKDKLKNDFIEVLNLFKEIYTQMGIDNYYFRLSLPDFTKDKFLGDKKDWDFSAKILREALNETKLEYIEAIGEAAFYGPKLDIQIKNIEGKEDTISTIQIDSLIPKRMNIVYINNKGEEENPIIIHRAILGSYERFMAFLIEKTGGAFPIKFSPIQIKVIPVSDKFIDDAVKINSILKNAGIRSEIDKRDESISKKIRDASIEKIPAKIVIGDKEIDHKKINGEWSFNINWREDLKYESNLGIKDLINLISKESSY
jgi:threonyl-tRNA synthetase